MTRTYAPAGATARDASSCEFVVLGSTGNEYAVRVGAVPSCSCPDALRGNHCKPAP